MDSDTPKSNQVHQSVIRPNKLERESEHHLALRYGAGEVRASGFGLVVLVLLAILWVVI